MKLYNKKQPIILGCFFVFFIIAKNNILCYNSYMQNEIFIVKDKTAEYTIEKSKFITYAFYCDRKEKVQEILKSIKREHLQSTHICYAYRILDEDLGSFAGQNLNFTQSYFDDGEPSGTAGAPILRAIEEANIYNVLIVVVRYFGGIKLGAAGLVKAYKQSAVLGIDKEKLIIKNVYKVECDYSVLSSLLNFCQNANIDILEKVFDLTAIITVAMVDSKSFLLNFENSSKIEFLGRKYL